jgi:outer membrane lipoprotein-sorting protein
MKTIALLAAIAATALSAPALAKPPAPAPVRAAQSAGAALELAGVERAQVLAAASLALNATRRITARFVQTAPDGAVTNGSLYLERPGKVRFQYDPPTPLLIVADGATVAVADTSLKTVDRTALRATPLYFVLKANVNLEKDAKIGQVTQQGDRVSITARDRRGETDGALTLVLSAKDYRLQSWSITDGAGQTTTVRLTDIKSVNTLDPKLFRLAEAEDPTARRRR